MCLKFQPLPYFISFQPSPSPYYCSSNSLLKELSWVSCRKNSFRTLALVSLCLTCITNNAKPSHEHINTSICIAQGNITKRENAVLGEVIAKLLPASILKGHVERKIVETRKKITIRKAALRKVLETLRGQSGAALLAKERSWNSYFSLSQISFQETS